MLKQSGNAIVWSYFPFRSKIVTRPFSCTITLIFPFFKQSAFRPSYSVSVISISVFSDGSSVQSGACPIFPIFTARTRTLASPHGSARSVSPS